MSIAEGIVLKVVPYRERDKVVTLYTPQKGKICAFARGSKREPLTWLQPIVGLRCLLGTSRGELYRMSELQLLHPFSAIRQKLQKIRGAAQMTKAVLKTQSTHEPNPILFSLYHQMLRQIEGGFCPRMAASTFTLKLLHLEGQIAQDVPPLDFSLEEWEETKVLLVNRSFEKLAGLTLSDSLHSKIETLLANE